MTEEFVIVSKENKFWIDKRDVSVRIIEQMKKDMEDIPQLIQFHELVVEVCKKKIEETKDDLMNKNETIKETAG